MLHGRSAILKYQSVGREYTPDTVWTGQQFGHNQDTAKHDKTFFVNIKGISRQFCFFFNIY